MKDYARELLSKMTDEERQEFMHGLPKEVIWKMAEGNPDTKEQHEHSGEIKTTTQIPPEAIAIIEEDLKAKKLHDELE